MRYFVKTRKFKSPNYPNAEMAAQAASIDVGRTIEIEYEKDEKGRMVPVRFYDPMNEIEMI